MKRAMRHLNARSWQKLLLLGAAVLAAACADSNSLIEPTLHGRGLSATALAAPGPNYVLILGSTVSGGASSQEAVAATGLGLSLQIVTDAQWATMTASDFASYRAIILGDPTCEGTPPPAAIANTAVWGPAVSGNVFIIGSDPSFHSKTLVMNGGIGFAAAAAGKTGAYITLSCYYDEPTVQPALELAGLSTLGSFIVTQPGGCFNDAYKTANHPALAGITSTYLSNWSCSVHEVFNSWPSDFDVLAIARGVGTFKAPDGTVGTPYILARGEGLVVISDITLAPPTGTAPVGTTYTFTAHVTTGGTPVAGKLVTFTVVDGPAIGQTGTATTNASGDATFGLLGAVAGTDGVRASFVDARSVTQTSNRATVTFIVCETTRPTVNVTGVIAGPPKQIQFTVQDGGSGLASIVVVTSTNAITTVPAFTPGTTSPVVVTSTKIDQSASSVIGLRVTDACGNVTLFDPLDVSLGRSSPKEPILDVVKSFTANGISDVEHFVRIQNGTPGLKAVTVNVNGKKFKIERLEDGEIRSGIDVSSAMEPGSNNTVEFEAKGKAGSSALVLLYQ